MLLLDKIIKHKEKQWQLVTVHSNVLKMKFP